MPPQPLRRWGHEKMGQLDTIFGLVIVKCPVNDFSVMLGQSHCLLGSVLTSTIGSFKCLAEGLNKAMVNGYILLNIHEDSPLLFQGEHLLYIRDKDDVTCQ